MNYFSIQTSNPIFKKLNNTKVKYLYEAMEKIYSDSTEKASLMSFEHEGQLAYVTENGVYLGFTENFLVRIVAKYLLRTNLNT